MSRILVIGSINMDILAKAPRFPRIGETVVGTDWETIPGGKGANQAVAVSKSGGKASMIGKVGRDEFGDTLMRNLKTNGVDITAIHKITSTTSGVALIVVDDKGNNTIVSIPGANSQLTINDLRENEELFESASILLIQLEIPWDTVAFAINHAQLNQVKIILDPAPAPLTRPAPDWLGGVDILTPNQVEAEIITGVKVIDIASAQRAAEFLLKQGVLIPIIKLGAEGVLVLYEKRFHHIPSFKVPVFDTTAAGDAFAGGLATALAEGKPLLEAIRFANAAGALSTTKFGAQSSIPLRAEIDKLLRS